jgi:hypothetical protein
VPGLPEPRRGSTFCPPEAISDSFPQPSRRSLIVTLLVFLAGVIGLNVAAARITVPSERWNRGEFIVASKWKLALETTAGADVLILGDSTCLVSVDPDSAATGRSRALNLCTVGDVLPLADTYLLENYLANADRPPSAVVVMHAYDIYSRQLSLDNFLLMPLSPLEAAQRAAALPGFRSQDRVMFPLRAGFHKLLPMFGRRAQLKSELGLTPRRDTRHVPITARGFMPTVKTSATEVEDDAAGHIRGARQDPDYHVSTYGDYALRGITSLAERDRFTVYLVQSPLYRELAADAAFAAVYRQYLAQLVALGRRSPCVVSLLDQPWLFGANEMQNADHILPEHVAGFTARLLGTVDAAPRPCR